MGQSEQRAPASWPSSLCRKKRRAQRGGDITISPRPPKGVRGASTGVRDDIFQEIKPHPWGQNVHVLNLATGKKKKMNRPSLMKNSPKTNANVVTAFTQSGGIF